MGAMLRRSASLCVGLLVALAAVGTPPAGAAVPCGEAVLVDWSDGSLDRVYSVACYRDALARLPEDLRAYSTAPEDIERALLERARADAARAAAPAEKAEQAEKAPRSLAGPAARPATTAAQDDAEADAPPQPAGPPADTQPPAGSDGGAQAVAAPMSDEPGSSTRMPAFVAAALILLAAGAAVPLLRFLADRRRGSSRRPRRGFRAGPPDR